MGCENFFLSAFSCVICSLLMKEGLEMLNLPAENGHAADHVLPGADHYLTQATHSNHRIIGQIWS
jgi:hypothetical protein